MRSTRVIGIKNEKVSDELEVLVSCEGVIQVVVHRTTGEIAVHTSNVVKDLPMATKPYASHTVYHGTRISDTIVVFALVKVGEKDTPDP